MACMCFFLHNTVLGCNTSDFSLEAHIHISCRSLHYRHLSTESDLLILYLSPLCLHCSQLVQFIVPSIIILFWQSLLFYCGWCCLFDEELLVSFQNGLIRILGGNIIFSGNPLMPTNWKGVVPM